MGEYITEKTEQLSMLARKQGLQGRVLLAEGHYSTSPRYIFWPDSNAALLRSRKNRPCILGETFERAKLAILDIAEADD